MVHGFGSISGKTLGRGLWGGLAMMLLVAGCKSGPEQVDTKAAEEAVRSADAAWSQAAVSMDAASVASYYADDAIVMPPNMPIIRGKDKAEKAWSELLVPGNSIAWTPSTVVASESGDMVYDQGTYTEATKGPDGKAIPETGKYLCVWKKQADGTWKSVADTWNSDLPVPTPEVAAPTKASR